MSPGQTGHNTGQMGRVHGTDGTHTRGCPAKILYVCWFFLSPILSSIAISLAIYRGHLGLSAQSPKKKSRKGFPGPLGPQGPESQKTIEDQLFFQVLAPFSTFFLTFSAPRGRDFLRTLGRKAQMAPVNGQQYRNSSIMRCGMIGQV